MPREATLSAQLHQARDRHRRVRVERVIEALRQRAVEIERRGRPVPAPLREAIRGFREELDALTRARPGRPGERR